jgi:DNA-binding transcriptional regulator GbsR (MarR family)
MDIFDLLDQSQFIVYNRKLAHKIGAHETIILMELISKYKYFKSQGQLYNGEAFFCTIDDLHEATALSRKFQDTAIKKLKSLDILSTKVQGIPAKRYFYINLNSLKKLLTSDSFSLPRKGKLD